MNFFTNPDWFGRSGPFAYNIDYIVFIILAITLAFVLPILLRKAQTKTIKNILIALWILALVLDIPKYAYNWVTNFSKDIVVINDLDFPLWTCSLYLYLMPIALFSKNEKLSRGCFAFICTISFFAGIVNFAVPSDDSLFSFYGMHKIVYHYILMLTPAIILGTGYLKLRLTDIFGSMSVLVIFGIPIYIFNAIFKQDYMFTYNGSWLPVDVSFISFKPLYTLFSLFLYAVITLLVIGIDIGVRKLFNKKS